MKIGVNNILKTDQKAPIYNENDKEKEVNYYNPSDFKKFNQLGLIEMNKELLFVFLQKKIKIHMLKR